LKTAPLPQDGVRPTLGWMIKVRRLSPKGRRFDRQSGWPILAL
jgi:hypothetical protein